MSELPTYINWIESKLSRLKGKVKLSDYVSEFDAAFENKDDKAMIRKLRVLNEKLNKKLDELEMDEV